MVSCTQTQRSRPAVGVSRLSCRLQVCHLASLPPLPPSSCTIRGSCLILLCCPWRICLAFCEMNVLPIAVFGSHDDTTRHTVITQTITQINMMNLTSVDVSVSHYERRFHNIQTVQDFGGVSRMLFWPASMKPSVALRTGYLRQAEIFTALCRRRSALEGRAALAWPCCSRRAVTQGR